MTLEIEILSSVAAVGNIRTEIKGYHNSDLARSESPLNWYELICKKKVHCVVDYCLRIEGGDLPYSTALRLA